MTKHAKAPPDGGSGEAAAAAALALRHAPARPALGAAQGTLVFGALGVVYGDIGTSPLYTLKTAYQAAGGAFPDIALGLLSLIVWTLIIIVSVKYVALVMRADNDGEGGILALMAHLALKGRERPLVVGIGILGAALLYGDGAITPAISVLSALEGLKLPAPAVAPFILPLAVLVLLALFAFQHHGTAVIGKLFGPVMVAWFVTIAGLGVASIVMHPGVLRALWPGYAMQYLATHGFTGFSVLGSVFLCATGAEALYADMGHFGSRPIRVGWYSLVFPALLLSYAGQTALVLDRGLEGDDNPFFLLAPGWAQLPLVGLATAATIIASQAIISGVFSMTRQAIQLDLCPRLSVTQTSEVGYGQIYIGAVNWMLMLFTLGLTLGFGSSDNLSAAYGIAVSITMFLTTLLMFRVMHEQWRWSLALVLAIAGPLFVVDTSFVLANLTKVREGGWVPLVAAAVIYCVMQAWRSGRKAMLHQLERETLPLPAFLGSMQDITRVPGTAVYLARRLDIVPLALLHSLKHYAVLHERNVILHVITEQVPRVPARDRIQISPLGPGFYRVVLLYGFMEYPDLPVALSHCSLDGQGFDMMRTTFFLSRETVELAPGRRLHGFARRLFTWMHRNATDATEFFRIPRNRIVELGARIEL
ncbi:putative potassium transport system protein kup 1 [Burkholderiales bacterium]|nr:putative potassium transport system protein kup 1 [Burkholderiales bacterium]